MEQHDVVKFAHFFRSALFFTSFRDQLLPCFSHNNLEYENVYNSINVTSENSLSIIFIFSQFFIFDLSDNQHYQGVTNRQINLGRMFRIYIENNLEKMIETQG